MSLHFMEALEQKAYSKERKKLDLISSAGKKSQSLEKWKTKKWTTYLLPFSRELE